MTFNTRNLTFISLILLANPFVELLADSQTSELYAIPHDKSTEEPCRKAALAARPGEILSFHSYNSNDDFHYHFQIEDHGKNWIVICDSATQKIIKNELEDVDKATH